MESDRKDLKFPNKGDVYSALINFFDAYLIERDVSKTIALLSDEFYSVGTGEDEVALDRKQFEKMMRMEIEALPKPIQYKIEKYSEKQTGEHSWDCFCSMETVMDIDRGRHIYYRTRLTAGFREENGKILAITFHMSEASRYQGREEFFPLRYVSEQDGGLSESAQHQLVDILCRIMPSGIIGVYVEEGFPLYVINDTLLQMLGYTYEEFVRITEGKVINAIFEEDRDKIFRRVIYGMEESKDCALEYRMKKKDGSYTWVHDVGRKITAEDGRKAAISVLVDISNEVEMRNALKREAERDFLTGVYNRKVGEMLISGRMKQAFPYTFLMIDLDNFKMVNDIYGHERGDEMLNFAGKLLQNSFRQSDIIIRIGGDEFAILAQPCRNMEAIQEKADRIIQVYAEFGKEKCPDSGTSISVGGIHSETAMSFEELYKLADKVLYEVKRTKKGSCKICKLK